MQSAAHVGGHPIHPMLIPYPFALLTTAVAFEAGARLTRRHEWADTASRLIRAGLGTAVVAALPGVVDYFGAIPARSKTRRIATLHGLSNVLALVCFSVAEGRRRDGRLPASGLSLALLGTGFLSLGGWLGGDLVYRERVGLIDRRHSLRIVAR